MATLGGRTALVTGASRGVGRGIALELGLAGACVYVTGRSREGGATTDDMPGTVDETARLVSEAGGKGIAVACDHTDDDAVERLSAQIRDEAGGLDILVNNVWGGYEKYDGDLFKQQIWEQPLWRFDKMIATGFRAHYTATRAVLPLMLESKHPLIVTISFGDEGKFLGDVQYDLAKAASTRLAFALGERLKGRGIPSVAVYPGFTRTEAIETLTGGNVPPEAHSPRFVGRGVAALAADPDVMERTGGAYKAGQLGLDYGFTDIDGTQPEPYVMPDWALEDVAE